MQVGEILDVTVIEPRMKHPTIFKNFDALLPGQHFIIHNDHDPKPLYYQLNGERGPVFSWEYLEEGPDYWKVKITKKEAAKEATIGELVAQNFRKAEVFKKFGIDFCCGGKKTISQACAEKGIEKTSLEQALTKVEAGKSNDMDFDRLDLKFLADYIESKHHTYVKEAIPVLYAYLEKVINVHGDRHPELYDIGDHFVALAKELRDHTRKEEEILFPYIRKMESAKILNVMLPQAHFGTIENPIRMMEDEHENAGSELEKINELTNNYTPPASACATYRVLFEKLKEFEADLHQHIHLENNILFPKAIQLEKDLQINMR